MTNEQFKRVQQSVAAVSLCLVLLETLDELGDGGFGGIPEGHAYMAFSGQNMSLNTFQSLLNGLKKIRAITVKDHLISKGPEFNDVLTSYTSLVEKFKEKFQTA